MRRNRRIAASMIMSMVAKAVSVATALISVPLTLHYLGAERYGMWMVMSSLMAMLAFADLGIGNGVLNSVAAAHGRDDEGAMRKAISSGLTALLAVMLIVLALLAVAYPLVAWQQVFNVRTELAVAESGPALAVFIGCFALSIPATMVQRVQMGLQQGFLASSWACGGSLLSLAGILLAIHHEAGLPVLVLAFAGGPLLANTINSLVFFGFQRRSIAPRITAVSGATAREVMRTGGLFLVLQLAAAAMYNSHNILIAHILGPEVVAQFAVPERLFATITMLASMALAPLWPAYREAIMRGDMAWTMRTLRRSVAIAAIFAASLSVPMMVLAPWILELWVGKAVNPPFALILGLGIWRIVESAGLALAMFLNGAHVVREQVIASALTAVASVLLGILLLNLIGISGSIWATLVCFLLLSFIPFALLAPRTARNMSR